jgi:aromatic ring-opening dioxygenase LigB subunit
LIVAGAIVPHAPVLLDGVGGVNAELVAPIRDAIASVRFPDADVLVVLSPHGVATGVYSRAEGSLRGFGVPGQAFDAAVDRAVSDDLANAWGVGTLDDELDHGALVPLSILKCGLPVVAATLDEKLPIEAAIEGGSAFAEALKDLDARVAFVASTNTSTGLTARAPLGLVEGAEDADRHLIELLSNGIGDVESVLRDVAAVGSSCGAGPLAAFTTLWPSDAQVLTYERPFGVGYLVAAARL